MSSRVVDPGGARPQARRSAPACARPGSRTPAALGSIDEWIAAGLLLEKLKVDTSVSSLVLVGFSSDDPKFAAEVANGFAKAYLDTVAGSCAPSRRAKPRNGSTSS